MAKKRYKGVSDAATGDSAAGFRAAAQAAVEDYKQKEGAPAPGSPVRLRVAEMYVEVQNPIHGYIVELEPTR
jgi:hypothetical protein